MTRVKKLKNLKTKTTSQRKKMMMNNKDEEPAASTFVAGCIFGTVVPVLQTQV
jgi:hypothetical protein